MKKYHGLSIVDEFTDLPVSRERKRQLRKVKKGVCRVASCREPIMVYGSLCEKHGAQKKEYERQRYRSLRESA